MTWIIILGAVMAILVIGVYKQKGEGYSAGRGMFRNSDYDLPENKKDDFNDYEPWNYDDMRK